MPQEGRNQLWGLCEHLVRNTLLPRAQAEHVELVEPLCHRIPDTVRQSARRGQVDLVPGALPGDPRLYGIAEHIRRQRGHELGEVAVLGRVLNDMSWQRAAVADEVAQERNFRLGHRRFAPALSPTRQRNARTWAEVVEATPTTE